MNDPDTERLWTFTFQDEEGIYHEDDGQWFIGNDDEAIKEGQKRSDAWEKRTGQWCYKITRESHGKVSKNHSE